ncbi:uncharacterized protein STEHIDRAFT_97703 [Stereum hirsutum FP-91666 SS1]|uniref:uncharacterized protein n=1 Tax=Stereum hirsutum (strain FP-91666) TaxID=721885 RepID=UPI000444969A|nr:uncharacterized protein STEHIDRAFT_97703 [Stereum hirsutum FP-91666 SS1]EIM86865.1 hypothetical protein STEHIDRAFT_97703 [Stereum hirsutum FP-91666 SS1]
MSSSQPTQDLKPTYVYKLVPCTVPIPLDLSNTQPTSTGTGKSNPNTYPWPTPYTLPPSPLDSSSGFIHLSTSSQLPGTLTHFFSSPLDKSVYVLRIPYDRTHPGVEDKMVRWEDPKAEVCGERGGEGMFPHLYKYEEEGSGLGLGAEEVESVAVWEREMGGSGEEGVGVEDGKNGWVKALKGAEGWLVY